MAVIFEVVAQFILEVLAYGVGRAVAAVFLPHFSVESLGMQKSMAPWKWRGFSYKHGSKKFLYTESIQVLGVATMLLVGAAIYLIAQYA